MKRWIPLIILLLFLGIMLFLYLFYPEVLRRISSYSGPGSPFIKTP